SNLTKQNIPPFTINGDINEAQFLIPTIEKPWWEEETEGECFRPTIQQSDISAIDETTGFSGTSIIIGSWFTEDEAHDYFEKFNGKNRKSKFKTSIRKGKTVWRVVQKSIGKATKTSEQMKKQKELDNPNRQWKILDKERGDPYSMLGQFIRQKIQNRIEFEELCASTIPVKD
ncbi:unnamed protein product, partial [Didymodactylos carnosus]